MGVMCYSILSMWGPAVNERHACVTPMPSNRGMDSIDFGCVNETTVRLFYCTCSTVNVLFKTTGVMVLFIPWAIIQFRLLIRKKFQSTTKSYKGCLKGSSKTVNNNNSSFCLYTQRSAFTFSFYQQLPILQQCFKGPWNLARIVLECHSVTLRKPFCRS